MAQSNWEADKMLDVYIYDYLLKRNLQNTAKSFMAEGKVAEDPVAIDAPGGFLFEWWSVFWDIFIARTNEKHSEVAASYIEAQQMKAREQQQIQMQQLQLMQRHAQLQRRDGNLNGPINAMNSEGMLGQSTASVLAAKLYEDRMKHPHSIDSESSSQLLDPNRMALLKSVTNHSGPLVQGSPGSVSTTLQQIQARTQQTTDMKGDVNLSVAQRSLPMDPSSIYSPGIAQSKPGLGNGGLNQGVSGLPTLKGWPLANIDPMRPNLGAQVQRPFLQSNQFQLLAPHQQQQVLAQVHAQGNLGNSPSFGDMDPRKLRVLTRGSLNVKDGQPSGNEGSVGSPMQSSSPKIRVGSQDQSDMLIKMRMSPMQQSSVQQQQDQHQQQQQHLQQNNKKRKQATSSGAANSTGTGNTVGPSPNSQPSTPSTHTPGDGLNMPGNIQQANNMPKGLMMYGADGTTGLASSSNQLEDMDHFGDVESFLSHDDGEGRDIFSTLKKSPAEHNTDSSKGFSFSEYSCIRTSNGKVVCCHFSSDGKLLASAGHEKKAVLWNMDTLDTVSTSEGHSHLITDIRFRPNSTQFATSSFDRTVRLWNAAEPSYRSHPYAGHCSQVMSLDFHPKKTELFCSSDSNGEIRFWNIGQQSSTQISKGGAAQVRFQPRVGQLLAAASEKVISIIDIETNRCVCRLQGHNADVQCVCWDTDGEYLASVSHDCVKVWSLKTEGEPVHELNANGNKFNCCVFHPSYINLLVVGGYQNLDLWNLAEKQCMSIPAHDSSIVALAQSPITGMVASTSHDKSVKIWK